MAETTAELHSLRLKHRQLEARAALLEKLTTLNQQPTVEQSQQNTDADFRNNQYFWEVCLLPFDCCMFDNYAVSAL